MFSIASRQMRTSSIGEGVYKPNTYAVQTAHLVRVLANFPPACSGSDDSGAERLLLGAMQPDLRARYRGQNGAVVVDCDFTDPLLTASASSMPLSTTSHRDCGCNPTRHRCHDSTARYVRTALSLEPLMWNSALPYSSRMSSDQACRTYWGTFFCFTNL